MVFNAGYAEIRVFVNFVATMVVAKNQCIGLRTMQQAQRYCGISRVVDSTLSFDNIHLDNSGPAQKLEVKYKKDNHSYGDGIIRATPQVSNPTPRETQPYNKSQFNSNFSGSAKKASIKAGK